MTLPDKPATPIRPTDLSALPAELSARPQWVTWQWEWDRQQSKWTKRPYIAGADRWASSTNPATWRTFTAACRAWLPRRQDGIGFALCAADPYVGVDLDHCRDLTSGLVAPWALDILATLRSYSEVTPSGTGLRIWLRGTLPDNAGRKAGNIEVYSTGRYLTVTGRQIAGTPAGIAERADVLAGWLAATFPPRPRPVAATSGPSLYSDAEIVERASRAANGAKFRALFYHGDAGGYHSGSEAHAALCAILAYWTRDAGQIDRLVSTSALAAHRKWATRPDYRDRTVTGALGVVTESYTPRRAGASLIAEARRG